MLTISKLQFITADYQGIAHWQQIERFYQAGGEWAQIRIKEGSPANVQAETQKAAECAAKYGKVLIVNDSPLLCAQAKAQGVHLGKNDMAPLEARSLLPKPYLIGGTANTLQDIDWLIGEGVDYIGLGPFRFTQTKKKLSPIIGLDGYRALTQQLANSHRAAPPIVAVGGILAHDITALLALGLGVAISGAVLKDGRIEANTEQLLRLLK